MTLRTTSTALLMVICATFLTTLHGQCETWVGHELNEQATNAHTIYRQALKAEDYPIAFENWQKAYEIAPAADGKRDFHYMDGITLYKHMLAQEPDKKEEYAAKIDMLYRQAADCYEAGKIVVHKCTGEDCGKKKAGIVLGRYGYDMVYTLKMPSKQSFAIFQESLDKAGMESEYTVISPYSYAAVQQFKQGNISAEEARAIYQQLTDLADHNIANGNRYAAQYEQAKSAMRNSWAEIEQDIFDCEYFKNKFEPTYDDFVDSLDILKYYYASLIQNGCDTNDAFVLRVKSDYTSLATKINAGRQAEFERNNPGAAAVRLYKEGKFTEAIEKYNMAIQSTDDPERLANYHFSIASIKFRKLDQYSAARQSARKAMEYRPDWGKPLMLIGDMYARSSRSCGSGSYEQGIVILAAIDKWAAAKRADSEVAQEAQANINKYSQYIPTQEDVFMRNEKEGSRVKTGCWVGETVTLKYRK